MAYPSVISTLATPQATDRLNNPSHSQLHQNENTGITEVQTFVGTLSSVPGTLMYDIRSSNSNGGGHVQTANKGGTGQTTFTKGDLLVATSSSVITKLAVGTDGNFLVADSSQAAGVKWGFGNAPTVRTYGSVVQIWTKPSTLSYLVVEMVGGGGGGGGGADVDNGTAGSGGGGGGYSRKTISAALLPAAVSVLAGIGGGGGTGAASGGTGGTASVGGISYFGSILSATGGGGGDGGNTFNRPGIGGIGIGGDLNANGSPGNWNPGTTSRTTSGGGGGTPLGGGGWPIIVTDSIGSVGGLYGGGGSGGTGNSSNGRDGGQGGLGVVIVYEY